MPKKRWGRLGLGGAGKGRGREAGEDGGIDKNSILKLSRIELDIRLDDS